MSAHIVTMGGGGFSMNPSGAPTALDRHLLDLAGVGAPRVCFVPTASADDPAYINKFLVAYGTLGVRPQVLTLWEGARESVEQLRAADIVFVGGGNTVNALALWRAHGVDTILRGLAATDGKVLAGISAGANCWFTACSTDSFGGFDPYRGGLELLPGSFCPHFDGEADRAPAFASWIADGTLPAGWACDDGAAIEFVDGVPTRFLAEREGARAYYVAPSEAPGGSGVTVEQQQMELV